MGERTSLALAVAVFCGAMVAVQARVNGELSQDVNDAVLAAVVSFGSGLVAVLLVVLARGSSRRAVRLLRGVPWWCLLGGLGGASLVAAGAYAAPRIGVALLTVAIVAGQTTGGLLVDTAGLGPAGRQAVTVPRLAGAALCLVAVLISVAGRSARSGHLPLLLVVVGSGLLIAFQQAVNGRVRRATGDAAVATAVNFVVGTTVLVLAYAAFSSHAVDHWPGADKWWLYTGGVIGATFVAMAAIVVRILGVLRLGLATVAGQLVGAIALDALVPTGGHGVAAATVLGAALTFVAVGISGRPSRSSVPATP